MISSRVYQSAKRRQTGNIIPALLVAFVLIMVTVATLINVFAATEEEAIDRHLAEIQGYWAMQGAMDYTLSAIRSVGTSQTSDASKITTLTSYVGVVSVGSQDYFGPDPLYRFNVTAGAATTSAVRGAFTLTLQLAGVSTNTPSVLNGIASLVLPLVVDLCLGEQVASNRTNDGPCMVGGSSTTPAITTINDVRRR